jgi:hypothetical protein
MCCQHAINGGFDRVKNIVLVGIGSDYNRKFQSEFMAQSLGLIMVFVGWLLKLDNRAKYQTRNTGFLYNAKNVKNSFFLMIFI